MRTIKLTNSEKKTLEEVYKNHSKAHFRLRCQTLLLSSESMTVEELIKITKPVVEQSIHGWIDGKQWE